jgi:hypothetical protein
VFEGAAATGMLLIPKSNKVGIHAASQAIIGKLITVTLTRDIETSAQKLLNRGLVK